MNIVKIRNYNIKKEGVKITRGNNPHLCNPYPLQEFASRKECLNKFKEYVWRKKDRFKEFLDYYIEQLNHQDVIFSCCCTPDLCHGDILARLVHLCREKPSNIAAIVGGRNFSDSKYMKKFLDKEKIGYIISGGASGADTMGAQYGLKNNISVKECHVEWDKYGKIAGFIRNKDIILNCDKVIAFWDGKSKGTKHSIDLAEYYKIPVTIYSDWS